MKKKRSAAGRRHSALYYSYIRSAIRGAVLFAAAAALLWGFSQWKISQMFEQEAARRWESAGGYSQISAFLSPEAGLPESDLTQVRSAVMQALAGDSIEPDPEKPGDRIFQDCYSGTGTVTIRSGKKSIEAEAVGTGGDFFQFHPLQLLSGSYYADDNLMKDQVLIDEETAWELFGSPDVAGRTLLLGEQSHIICGVFRRPQVWLPENELNRDGMSEDMETDLPVLFVPYRSLLANTAGRGSVSEAEAAAADMVSAQGSSAAQGSAAAPEEADPTADTGNAAADQSGKSAQVTRQTVTDTGRITCYEIVLPGPVEGYARQVVLRSIGRESSQLICVDNTFRWTLRGRLNGLTKLGTRGVRTAAVKYPRWENAAAYWEEILILLLGAQLLFVLAAVWKIVKVIVFMYRNRTWSLAGGLHSLQEAVYERQSEKQYPEYYGAASLEDGADAGSGRKVNEKKNDA
ncbi:MAG: ABC transporter permease [Lachnospiraceae bacterium]|nr:ABC transporter permease [Lachnospiraceae bacterium]